MNDSDWDAAVNRIIAAVNERTAELREQIARIQASTAAMTGGAGPVPTEWAIVDLTAGNDSDEPGQVIPELADATSVTPLVDKYVAIRDIRNGHAEQEWTTQEWREHVSPQHPFRIVSGPVYQIRGRFYARYTDSGWSFWVEPDTRFGTSKWVFVCDDSDVILGPRESTQP